MRITRLINGDTILDRIRIIPVNRSAAARRLAKRATQRGDSDIVKFHQQRSRRWATIAYFVECPWCVSIWVALATAWLPMFFADNRVVQYIGIALATSHLVGVFAFAADTEEIEVEETTQ